MEEKIDSLKLNHIPRRLNEAGDALAKVVAGRESVPTGVFASDQHKPSVLYERSEPADDGSSKQTPGANPPMALSDPEVMELEVDPTTEHDPPDD